MSAAHQQTYTRFDIFQRVEHFVLILSFTILGLTGLPQKYPDVQFSQDFINFLGGIETTRIIHRVAATVFLLEAIYHLIVVGYKLYVQRKAATMVPSMLDAQNVVQWVGYNLGRTKTRPKMPRYNFMEKAEYLAMLWGFIVMAITGFMLWNPILTTRLLPGDFIPAAKVAHGGEAVLAVLAIILWHFYHVHVKFLNRSMFTGQITRHEMEHEHAAELEEIESGRVYTPPPSKTIQSRMAIFVPAAAVVSLALLAGVYWFITFEQTATLTTVLPQQQQEQESAFSPQTPTPFPTELPAQVPEPTSEEAQPPAESPGEQPVARVFSWETDMEDLFDERCADCHGDAGGFNAESYEAVMQGVQAGNPENSPVVLVLVSGNHPTQIRQDEIGRIRAWITAGAPETAEQAGVVPTSETGGETGSAVAWDGQVGELFQQKCTACHGQLGDYNAETYEAAMEGVTPGDADASSVVEVQQGGNHPGQFTEEELALIIEWINAGAPETAPAGGAAPGGSGNGNPLTWNGGLQQAFDAKCGSCHGSVGGFSADSYDQVMEGITPGDPDASSVVTVQQEGGHPGMFSEEELEQVILWVQSGAPEE